MMAKLLLGQYLTDGLDELRRAGIDVDNLAFMSVSSGS
jgi:hypothetical protein